MGLGGAPCWERLPPRLQPHGALGWRILGTSVLWLSLLPTLLSPLSSFIVLKPLPETLPLPTPGALRLPVPFTGETGHRGPAPLADGADTCPA